MHDRAALVLFLACVLWGSPACTTAAHEDAGPAVQHVPGTTKGVIDIERNQRPSDAKQLVGDTGITLVPESDGESGWSFADGVLTASSGWDSLVTPDAYRDFVMHVEFNVNDDPSEGQEANGNSGVYIQQRYELQINNAYGVPEADYTDAYCGSIYRLRKPDQIVCRPAGQWQSFDIVFRAARFDGDQKTENARVTVYHNGVLIHDDVAMPNKTGAGQQEGPAPRPIKLQGHQNPVRFRNVWVLKTQLE